MNSHSLPRIPEIPFKDKYSAHVIDRQPESIAQYVRRNSSAIESASKIKADLSNPETLEAAKGEFRELLMKFSHLNQEIGEASGGTYRMGNSSNTTKANSINGTDFNCGGYRLTVMLIGNQNRDMFTDFDLSYLYIGVARRLENMVGTNNHEYLPPPFPFLALEKNEDGILGWVNRENRTKFISSADLAEFLVRTLMELVIKQDRQKVYI